MYYEGHGEPQPCRAPLMLIHGGGSTIESNFNELIPLLAETRQVIPVEEEGHGRTQPIDRALTAEYSAADVAAVPAAPPGRRLVGGTSSLACPIPEPVGPESLVVPRVDLVSTGQAPPSPLEDVTMRPCLRVHKGAGPFRRCGPSCVQYTGKVT
jgi:hypothetical protein